MRQGRASRVVFAFLALIASSHFACAQSASPNRDRAQIESCGATASDALKQAQHLLAQNDAVSERKALACLIKAVSSIQMNNAVASRKGGNVIAVPFTRESGVP